jgi:hypothetical protein
MSAAGAEFYNFLRVGERPRRVPHVKLGLRGPAPEFYKMPYSLVGLYPDKFQILSERRSAWGLVRRWR